VSFGTRKQGDGPVEVEAVLRSLEDFHQFRRAWPEAFSKHTETESIARIKRVGIATDFFGAIGPGEVITIGPEMREHLFARSVNSRQRGMLELILAYSRKRGINPTDLAIYGHEAMTPLALLLRGRFPRFIGTEYCRTEDEKRAIFPILHGDVCNSHWQSDAFDLITSNDVLEHVPDLDAALRESARILKPGGRFLGTFPFLFGREVGSKRALVENGAVVHLEQPPIYHGNPMDPEGGSLVFEVPAWDIIQRARVAGFADAAMLFWMSTPKGVLASCDQDDLPAKGIFYAMFDKAP